MSNVHIATAANEVASALPSTATVTVSKHGIAAIETLNLEARTASQSHLMWSRTFSGMEIVTNPTLHYEVEMTLTSSTAFKLQDSDSLNKFNLRSLIAQSVRLTSDPISTAASNISVTVNNAEMTVTPDKESRLITTTYPDERSPAHQRCHYGLNQLDQFGDANFRSFSNVGADDVEKQHNTNALRENYPKRIYFSNFKIGEAGFTWHLLTQQPTAPIGGSLDIFCFKFVWDVYQPLSHPYFRDNAMRDNTLVNLRYFDCQIYIDSTDKMVELAPALKCPTIAKTHGGSPHDLIDDTWNTWIKTQATAASKLVLKEDGGIDPTLIFDLITPSVPLPTISDKPLKVLHTMTSTATESDLNMEQVRSGNIQLSQVPDMIYVFLRSNKMDSYGVGSAAGDFTKVVPTRLGVCTNLRVRTPQNAAFLLNMDQESLYQMSIRNGSKQSRSAFMCSLGSVICIDPEKDLGGYTNGVLAPFTFEVVGDFSQPCADGSKSRLGVSDLVMDVNTLIPSNSQSTAEYFTLYVVCELHGHLYLMSDGTGKQTKSNLTVSEVAEAVGEGVHHPSTFPMGRVSKMDSGVLSEVANSSGDVGDDVRAALRD